MLPFTRNSIAFVREGDEKGGKEVMDDGNCRKIEVDSS
jgi:hypothetical protein